MPEAGKLEFSLEEVRNAISGLDVEDQQLILASLGQQAEKRREEAENRILLNNIVVMAVWYQRAFSDNVSSSNIEGWTHDTGERAEEVLQSIADKPELNELDIVARDTAVALYFDLNTEINEDVDLALLERAGIDIDTLPEQFGLETIGRLAKQLQAKLTEVGIELPELNEEGMYGEDDDPEFYIHNGKKYYI